MRWNHKIGTFTVLLALGITMAGCGASSSTAGSTAASTPSTTSSEAQEAQKTEVQPMQGVLLSDPLSDGTYHISFESDKVWVGERKNTINDAVVYDYDRYTAPEIEALSEGDTIVTHLNGTEETTALTVESIERENNYVTINGGIEEGGIDLCKEDLPGKGEHANAVRVPRSAGAEKKPPGRGEHANAVRVPRSAGAEKKPPGGQGRKRCRFITIKN